MKRAAMKKVKLDASPVATEVTTNSNDTQSRTFLRP